MDAMQRRFPRHQRQRAAFFQADIGGPQQQVAGDPRRQRCDAVHAGRHQRHPRRRVGAAGDGRPQIVQRVMRKGRVFLPLHQRFVERTAQFLQPHHPGRVGAYHGGRQIPPQQFVHHRPRQRCPAGPGDAHDYRPGHYSATAKMVNPNSDTDITLLYWNSGERSLDKSSAFTRLFSRARSSAAMAHPAR